MWGPSEIMRTLLTVDETELRLNLTTLVEYVDPKAEASQAMGDMSLANKQEDHATLGAIRRAFFRLFPQAVFRRIIGESHKESVQINLNRLPIRDLSPLVKLTRPVDLYLSRTQVSDLSPLARLSVLIELHVSSTQISDLGPLATLASLEYLDISNTQVSDLGPLVTLTSLKILDISNTKVLDLSPLFDLPHLELLRANNTLVSEEQCQNLKKFAAPTMRLLPPSFDM